MTFVLLAFVVPRSDSKSLFVYFGIRYNCFLTINELPVFPLTTLLKVIGAAPFAAGIVSLPRVVPTMLLLFMSPRLFSTSLFAVLSTCSPPA